MRDLDKLQTICDTFNGECLDCFLLLAIDGDSCLTRQEACSGHFAEFLKTVLDDMYFEAED